MQAEGEFFEEASARQARLDEEFSATQSVEVVGIVSPGFVSGGRDPGESQWTMRFSLEAWRIEGQAIVRRYMPVQRSVKYAELEQFKTQILPDSVIRIRARVLVESSVGFPQAQFEEFLCVESTDAEMNELAIELRKPVTKEDPVFGTLTKNRELGRFEGKTSWNGSPIVIYLDTGCAGEIADALNFAHTIWGNQAFWYERVRDFAVKELLPLKNKAWLDDDELELTPEQFKARMTLRSVTVYSDGYFDFWHNDGDLFLGHTIEISGNLNDGLTHANIPG